MVRVVRVVVVTVVIVRGWAAFAGGVGGGTGGWGSGGARTPRLDGFGGECAVEERRGDLVEGGRCGRVAERLTVGGGAGREDGRGRQIDHARGDGRRQGRDQLNLGDFEAQLTGLVDELLVAFRFGILGGEMKDFEAILRVG